MKDQETKNKFIEARAAGKSYDKISKELGVSKPVLIGWSREFGLEINNLKSIAMDGLRENFALSEQKRLELLGEILEKLKQEAMNRNYSGMPDHKVLELIIKYSEAVGEMMPVVEFRQKEPYDPNEKLKELLEGKERVVSWEA